MMQADPKPALNVKEVWQAAKEVWNFGLHLGEGDKAINITLGLLVLLGLAFMVTGFIMKALRNFFTRKMDQEDRLKFFSVFKYVRYLTYVVVILFTMSAAGIDITILITASAALFVGVGLALQELIQDIIAGILILVDKSLRVGDIIEHEGKIAKILDIKLRSTRALTRDDKVLIIPNHKFISDVIYNYTQNHRTTRESVTVGVAYGSDVQLVTRLLIQAAHEQRGVIKNPKPFVLFEDFGDSALVFSIYFFLNDSYSDPKVKSGIRYSIDALFREHKISIPFPQRDVRIYPVAQDK
jgi:small-conductance mechanosensitive channel